MSGWRDCMWARGWEAGEEAQVEAEAPLQLASRTVRLVRRNAFQSHWGPL